MQEYPLVHGNLTFRRHASSTPHTRPRSETFAWPLEARSPHSGVCAPPAQPAVPLVRCVGHADLAKGQPAFLQRKQRGKWQPERASCVAFPARAIQYSRVHRQSRAPLSVCSRLSRCFSVLTGVIVRQHTQQES